MKTRHGFVSNSSSSSFVVAVKPGQDEVKVTFPLSEIAARTINSVADLDRWDKGWKEDQGRFDDSKYHDEIYNKCLNALKEGKIVLMGSFSNEDGNVISGLLYEQGGLTKEIMPEGGEIIEGGNE